VRQLAGSSAFWIGASDHAVEGTFRHVSGAAVVFAPWSGGEPSNSGNREDCVAYPAGSSLWSDRPCSEELRVVCEYVGFALATPRLWCDTDATIPKAHRLVQLYADAGIGTDRVLIKIASTWEGIRAAEALEREGIHCNLTLLFSFAQAVACAEAGVFLISPFVGRILDWHLAHGMQAPATPQDDPGVQSVARIWQHYKRHGYAPVVMGASFRNTGEVLALAGCDRLTISPDLLAALEQSHDAVERALVDDGQRAAPPTPLGEAGFRWQHNEDAMATEKLAEGIRKFAADQRTLEALVAQRMG
jgi:transaldolase